MCNSIHVIRYMVLGPTILIYTFISSITSWSGPREQAYRLHERLAGIPPSSAVLASMENKLLAGDSLGAAYEAIGNPAFLNLTIKQLAAPTTNRDQNMDVPLNDYTATIIGMIRDDVPFDQVLYGDIIYKGNESLESGNPDDGPPPGQIRSWSARSNNHFADLEDQRFNLADPNVLVKREQVPLYATSVNANERLTDVAGVLTTRAAAQAFFDAGTNRRMFRFTLINYLCRDNEDTHDTSVPDFRVRRDVERAPAGDSRVYKNKCQGCHAGMDAMSGAFAYHDYNGAITQNTTPVGKYNDQSRITFSAGFATTNNSWMNLWTTGVNQSIGWREPDSVSITSGNGMHSLGKVFAKTRAFSDCMVQRVFEKACLRKPETFEKAALSVIANKFEENNRYNMKDVFARVSTLCLF